MEEEILGKVKLRSLLSCVALSWQGRVVFRSGFTAIHRCWNSCNPSLVTFPCSPCFDLLWPHVYGELTQKLSSILLPVVYLVHVSIHHNVIFFLPCHMSFLQPYAHLQLPHSHVLFLLWPLTHSTCLWWLLLTKKLCHPRFLATMLSFPTVDPCYLSIPTFIWWSVMWLILSNAMWHCVIRNDQFL